MNFSQRLVYLMLVLKEKGLKVRLGKHLRTSVGVATSKTVISGNCTLTLNAETNKSIELVRQNMLDIVKSSNFSSEFLLDFAKKRGVKIVYVKDVYKILALLSEEEGLIFERRGFAGMMLNLLSGAGIGFKSKPMFLLEKGNNDFYFLLFHFYKLYGYLQKLPGYDFMAQDLFKFYSKSPENSDISQLGLEEMMLLQEAIARDNEASEFVVELAKQRDGAKKVLSKLKDGGASL